MMIIIKIKNVGTKKPHLTDTPQTADTSEKRRTFQKLSVRCLKISLYVPETIYSNL